MLLSVNKQSVMDWAIKLADLIIIIGTCGKGASPWPTHPVALLALKWEGGRPDLCKSHLPLCLCVTDSLWFEVLYSWLAVCHLHAFQTEDWGVMPKPSTNRTSTASLEARYRGLQHIQNFMFSITDHPQFWITHKIYSTFSCPKSYPFQRLSEWSYSRVIILLAVELADWSKSKTMSLTEVSNRYGNH